MPKLCARNITLIQSIKPPRCVPGNGWVIGQIPFHIAGDDVD